MTKTALLNRRAVRQFALDHAAQTRAHKFSRVGDSFFVTIEEALKSAIRNHIRNLPSKGKTIL